MIAFQGADGYHSPLYLCDVYFNGSRPCFGGVLALDGATGDELWRHSTQHEVYALNCDVDLTGDDVKDCLAAGRAGVSRVACAFANGGQAGNRACLYM